MSKTSFKAIVKGIGIATKKYTPELLTGIGIVGMLAATVLAVRATPKALRLLEEKKKEAETEKLPPVETVKTTWTCYIPAAVTGTLSAACLIGAGSVNARRRAALATAYSLAESAAKEYQEKVIETIGEKKEQAVRDAVAKEKLEKNPASNREVVVTEKGNTLCYDSISGRYFRSDIDRLKKSENELNRRLLDEMWISLNDFYYEIGLREIDLGDELGWNLDNGYVNLDFSSQLADDGTPCLVVEYHIEPRYDYRNA